MKVTRIVNVVGLIVLAALVVGLYRAKTDAEADKRRATELAAELESGREAVRVMRNEIGYLESPERLRALAEERLGLEPIDPLRVVTLEDAPLLIEPAPLAPEAPVRAEASYVDAEGEEQ